MVEFAFDPAKDQANRARHEISLAAAKEFEIHAVVRDERRNYDEERFNAFGVHHGRTYCLTFARCEDRSRRMACAAPIPRSAAAMSLEHPPLPPDDAPFDDHDNPEWRPDMFARARPAEEVLPPEILAVIKRARGRPTKARPKIRIAVRLDPEVVDHFRATGPGWQTRINDALVSFVRK